MVFILLSCDLDGTLPVDFVYLEQIAPNIKTELRYFSTNNFVGDTISGYEANRCIITKDAALALQKVQSEVESLGYCLLVFDAYRPQQAVDHFVDWAEDLQDTLMKSKFYPNVDKDSLFDQGYISNKSGHSRGSTVDLTIIYTTGPYKGMELDMGSTWDFFSPFSWPLSEEVNANQKANRMLLRNIMVRHGFYPYEKEWWHFTLVNEPFPETYFDFPVE